MTTPKTVTEIRAQRTITPQMREQIAEERELPSAETALCALRERAASARATSAPTDDGNVQIQG